MPCTRTSVCVGEIEVPSLQQSSQWKPSTPSHSEAGGKHSGPLPRWCDFTDAGNPAVPSNTTWPSPCAQKPDSNIRASFWPQGQFTAICHPDNSQGPISLVGPNPLPHAVLNVFFFPLKLPSQRSKYESRRHFSRLFLHLAHGYSPCP